MGFMSIFILCQPTDIKKYFDNVEKSPNYNFKGIKNHKNIVKYSGSPFIDNQMKKMFVE